MHRHRTAWPIVRSPCSTSRSTATATKAKPSPVDNSVSHEPTNLKRWSLPPTSLPDKTRRPIGEKLTRQGTNSQPSPFYRTPASLGTPSNAPKSNLTKWTREPPLTGAVKSAPPLFKSKPQQLHPMKSPSPLGATSKWDPSSLNLRQTPSRDNLSLRKDSHSITSFQVNPRSQQDLALRHKTLANDQYTFNRNKMGQRFDSRPPQPFGLRVAPNSPLLPGESSGPGSFITTQQQQPISKKESTSFETLKNNPTSTTWEHPTVVCDDGANSSSSRNTRFGKYNRAVHKERGTLLSMVYQDKHVSATTKTAKPKVQKMKKLIEKKVIADVYIPSTLSVGTLARLLDVRLENLQRKMKLVGMAEEAKYDHVLTSDYAALLAEEFGRNPVINDEAAFDIYPPPSCSDPSLLRNRPPVVTIMGHVDHGKTTLLDSLRSSSVAQGEAGGITQHIGAFSVPVPVSGATDDGLRSITFLDTPGHAAFSAMRARGARVTDFVVLVVAADDGIMPQTKEVIDLIKKEGKLSVVVAINKVDKPGADVDAVHKALLAEDIHLEALGGDIPSVEVSGLTGHGLPALVETLSAMAEIQDLRAEQEGPVQGYILESNVHKGLGPVATVLILRGCLKLGAHLISGLNHAKVRAISDPTAASVKAAYPGMAVTVSGWKTLPNAGDEVLQGSEGEVKKALSNRQRKAEIEATLVDIEAINTTRRQERERRELELELGESDKVTPVKDTEQGPKELRLIIKGDVSGSAEAVKGALEGIGNNKAVTRIISSGVGDISESDVMMAKTVGGTIVGFSVNTPRAIEILATQNEVPIISSNIIYRLMDLVKDRIISLLPVIIETRVIGEAIVLQLFEIQLKGKQTKKVAGCRVTNGVVEKSKFARLVRDGTVIHEGTLDTMRVLKKDVTEIRKGSECGLCFGITFADLREGDVIQMYEKMEKAGLL